MVTVVLKTLEWALSPLTSSSHSPTCDLGLTTIMPSVHFTNQTPHVNFPPNQQK